MTIDQYVSVMDDYTNLRSRMVEGISELAEYFPRVRHTILLLVKDVGFLTILDITYVKHAEGLNIIFENDNDEILFIGDHIQISEISTDDLQFILKSLMDAKNNQ